MRTFTRGAPRIESSPPPGDGAPVVKFPRAAEHRPQISITGTIGSGKSTVGRAIAEMLGWEYVSTGSAQREIAQSLHLSTLELNRIAENDTNVDDRIDRLFTELKSKDNIVVDSRMAWYFLPDSFKVRLVLPPEIAARRILRDATRDAEKYTNEEIAASEIAARAESERKRFLNTYKVDLTHVDNYDLVIDTADISAPAVCYIIFRNYILWREKIEDSAATVWPRTLQRKAVPKRRAIGAADR